MPDLDQFLDTLVADVRSGTRAPGAPTAIKQAHRRRAKIAAAAAAAAVVVLAVGGGLAAGIRGGSDRLSPAGEPTPPSASSTMPERDEGSSDPAELFRKELRKTLARVPDWAITNVDPAILGPCAGEWSSEATGGTGGSFGIRSPGEPPFVWDGMAGFPSADQASDGAARLVENLASCTAAAWRTQPIAQTGAVLASSSDGVVWIHQKGATVHTLEVPTADGPPPPDVQVEVANLIWSSTG